ncbi:MAG TPA: polysaccharide export protein EpsE [Burkholderiales bacterium]|jgi:polysaccharide export outer membrane protein|nr:polysaccharide export protein EpsE [Burkholderiales bacterium]
MKRILIGLLLMAAALPAWTQNREKLGVGDAVRVTVFQQPDLTTDARISERGTVAMPLVGEVKIAGMAPGEAASQIANALKNGKYLKHPQVTIALTTVRSRQVSVLGLVARPGRYPLDDTSTRLADLVAAAGGIATGGSDTVTVIRNGQAHKVAMLAKSFELQNGDTVYIERAPVFYVYGEVLRGGAYPVSQNLTVMQAISLGGGITPRGSDRRVKLRRTGPDGKVVETDAKLQDIVQPDDVIFVKESLF